jgi:hypothetical protein
MKKLNNVNLHCCNADGEGMVGLLESWCGDGEAMTKRRPGDGELMMRPKRLS